MPKAFLEPDGSKGIGWVPPYSAWGLYNAKRLKQEEANQTDTGIESKETEKSALDAQLLHAWETAMNLSEGTPCSKSVTHGAEARNSSQTSTSVSFPLNKSPG